MKGRRGCCLTGRDAEQVRELQRRRGAVGRQEADGPADCAAFTASARAPCGRVSVIPARSERSATVGRSPVHTIRNVLSWRKGKQLSP